MEINNGKDEIDSLETYKHIKNDDSDENRGLFSKLFFNLRKKKHPKNNKNIVKTNNNNNNNNNNRCVQFNEINACYKINNKSHLEDVKEVEEEEEDENNGSLVRDEWTNKIEYMLSVIGYVVDLGNCVRFPYVTYKNGGGAFLIPYFIFLILIGTPMMYLEMAVGQYYRTGNITLWGKINPYMKGIGIASLMVVCYITLYYATIISYAVFYMFASFREVMPWSTCKNSWNTEKCVERVDTHINETNIISFNKSSNQTYHAPAEEYYNFYMLKIQNSTGIDNLGGLKLDLVLCLAAVYFLMYICIYKGVKSTGKAVYVTAVLPYVVLVILLIRAVTLPGSSIGLYYFLTPTFKHLMNYQCWKDAAIQIFFTLGPGISVLTTYASYSKFKNNCQVDALFASTANVIASLLAGLVVFASLGHLSLQVSKPIDDVVQEGMGLSFIAYPEILATLPGSTFFSIIFFLMIINLGLDSGFGGLEAIYTALADEIKIVKENRKLFMALVHIVLFLCSLPTVTYGGNYLVIFLDHFSTSPALMLVVFCETVTVTWIFGLGRFLNDVKSMIGFRPNKFWQFCWIFACPSIIFVLFIMSIALFEKPTVGDYVFPNNYIILGWCINCSVMLPLPLYAIYKYISNRKAKKYKQKFVHEGFNENLM